MERIKELIKKLKSNGKIKVFVQFIKFGMVGLTNTLISLAVTYAFIGIVYLITHQKATTLLLDIGTTLGFIAGVINSYALNSRFVFKNKTESSKKKAFFKVFVCYGLTYLLSMLIMNVFVNHTNIPELLAPMLRLVITIPLNFIANKLWAFKDKDNNQTKEV